MNNGSKTKRYLKFRVHPGDGISRLQTAQTNPEVGGGVEVIDRRWLLFRGLTAPTEQQIWIDGEKWNFGAEVELLPPRLFGFLVFMNRV